jgi:hypothetical protein
VDHPGKGPGSLEAKRAAGPCASLTCPNEEDVGNQQAVHVKAKSVLVRFGHSEGDTKREYTDWHIEIRGGLAYVSVWWSAQMVFLSMTNVPVFYQPGPWEQHLDRLFHRPDPSRTDVL